MGARVASVYTWGDVKVLPGPCSYFFLYLQQLQKMYETECSCEIFLLKTKHTCCLACTVRARCASSLHRDTSYKVNSAWVETPHVGNGVEAQAR